MTGKQRRTQGHRLPVLGTLVLLLGAVLAGGGAWLLILKGSWYYLPTGLCLVIAGLQLLRGRGSGLWWFLGVLLLSIIWTAWESGLDYWRWIPRLGLLVLLGILVAWRAPRLIGGPRPAIARGIAAALALVFVAAFALAFAPHNVQGSGAAHLEPASAPAFTGTQPALAPAPEDWAAYGRSQAAQRFSPLTQITAGNVAQLMRAWVYRTGDLPETRWGAETTPLKIDDTLYLCSATNVLIALDAATGRERWRYDPKVASEAIPYTAACRGVAYYDMSKALAKTDPPTDEQGGDATVAASVAAAALAAPAALTDCPQRIIEGTLDGRLIAVDARTGVPCGHFGVDGQVDITLGMGEVSPGMVSITSAPTIVRGVIVTGHQVLDGQYRWAPSGVIEGYDVVSGELRWAWDVVHPERNGAPPPGETYARGTPNMWTTATADEALGLVYLPMGNSAADYWSGLRSAQENAFATSLVALNVETGKPEWHFQTVHMDVWDYDLGSQATLVDFPTTSGPVPALVLPSKQGDLYVLDRRTGEPLTGVEERPVPHDGVESSLRSPTQPFSLFHTLARRTLTEQDMWGITPIDQLVCRIQFRQANYEGMYTPPVAGRHWVEYPGYNGGSDWGGIAVDPSRGIIVANYNDMPNYNELVPRAEADKMGWAPRDQVRGVKGGAEGAGDPQIGTPYAINVNAGWRMPYTGLPCKEPPLGGIRAIALASGETLWDRPLGTGRTNGPFGIPSRLPVQIGTPNNGGAALTASGLVFIAAATDNLIRAIDIRTGETLWTDTLPAGGQATPAVYAVDGREYLILMTGGHHFMETQRGDQVTAWTLPRAGSG
jgi:quinoprotein glucose dehydrogenase